MVDGALYRTLKIWQKYPKASYLAHLNVALEVSVKGLYMTYIPQIEPIRTLKNNHLSVLKKLTNGPVFLSQRSKMAAVLLSTHEFEALMKDATQYRRMLLADQHSQEMDEGQFVTQEALKAGLKERGLS